MSGESDVCLPRCSPVPPGEFPCSCLMGGENRSRLASREPDSYSYSLPDSYPRLLPEGSPPSFSCFRSSEARRVGLKGGVGDLSLPVLLPVSLGGMDTPSSPLGIYQFPFTIFAI